MLRVTLFTALLATFASSGAQAQLDLHAHLDIKPGVGPLLRGDFHSPPRASAWTQLIQSRVSGTSLTAFDSPPLIVMAFYGHPFLSIPELETSVLSSVVHFDGRENVRQAADIEYENLVAFVKANPSFAIAKSPLEAENLIADKRIPIVLSIEGAYGNLETEADLKKWIDERGVSIVTPFHLSEDHFGGVALMSGIYGFLNNPFTYLQAALLSGGNCIFNHCKSTVGIKNDGRELIDQLIKRKVWIDLAHANDLSLAELLPILSAKKLPILVTHTSPQEVFPAERGLSNNMMNSIIDNDGIVGLIPTQDMIKKSWNAAECLSGIVEYKNSVKKISILIGPERVTMASDINAPLTGLSPLCDARSGQILSEIEEHGFYTYKQWNALGQYVTPDPEWSQKSLRHFLKLWKRVRDEQI